MKFKLPTKGRKETSKSKKNEFPENWLKLALKDRRKGPEAQAERIEASDRMEAADGHGLQNELPPAERGEKKVDLMESADTGLHL